MDIGKWVELTGRLGRQIKMIAWKNQRKNAYPNIILSDSVIDDLQINNGNIILNLRRLGFALNCDGKFYCAKSSQVVIEDCDIYNISVQFIYRKKKISGKTINVIKDIAVKEFINNISNQKWKYEIVEEYYSETGGLFIGRIREKKHSMWCYVKAQFENMVYYWNEIDYNYTVN